MGRSKKLFSFRDGLSNVFKIYKYLLCKYVLIFIEHYSFTNFFIEKLR